MTQTNTHNFSRLLFPMRGQTARQPLRIKLPVSRWMAAPLIGFFSLVAPMAPAVSVAADEIEAAPVAGYWLTEDSRNIVEIAPCGPSDKYLCGTVAWATDGSEGAGNLILQNFRSVNRSAGEKWVDGKVFFEDQNKGQKGKLDLVEEGLKVSSCQGPRCTYSVWSRPSATMTAEAGLTAGR